MDKYRFAIIIGVLLGTFLGGIGVYAYHRLQPDPEPVVVIETEIFPVPTVIYGREEIGVMIDGYRKTGDLDIIADFYNNFVDDMELTYLILSTAQVYQIPENVLFALIGVESNYKPGAVNGANTNGTNDKGLMQLNSKYFGHVDRLDPYANLQAGCAHLRERYNKYGTWDAAIMYYNGFSQRAVKHQGSVLKIERELDRNINYLFFDSYTGGYNES